MLNTKRLIIRHLTLEDDSFILNLVNSKPWIQFIGDRNIHDRSQARSYLSQLIESYKELPLGLSCLELASSGQPIGICGLLKRKEFDHPDLGYALFPDFFGQGYALEAAHEIVVKYQAATTEKKLLAIVTPNNLPSIRLLEKLDFKKTNITYAADTSLTVYQL